MSPPLPLEALDREFESSLARALQDTKTATVLFSGGVDSAVVAQAAAHLCPVSLRTVGRAGSEDLRVAERAAQELELPWTGVVVEAPAVGRAVAHAAIAGRPEPMRSVLASFALALTGDILDPVLVGQGADELFGGYAHYRGLSPEEFLRRQAADWDRLLGSDWPDTVALGRTFGRSLSAPFLDPGFSAVARPLGRPAPPEGEPTKPALREWALHRGVPRSIALRPKKAIQYGSGIAGLVRSLAER
jgi:asparagine synthase (glutamine-hydrolysing)